VSGGFPEQFHDAHSIMTQEGMLDAVKPIISKVMFEHKLSPLTLGGDHSITYPLCKAVRDLVRDFKK
jgi:arginase family enzyme